MSIKIEIPQEKIDSPSSVLKLSGLVTDSEGNQLAIPSLTDHVEMRFAERVLLQNGNIATIPEDTSHFHVLPVGEYYFYNEVQPARSGIASKPYTFLFQPDKNRRPFFPNAGIFEVHFRFIPANEENDIVELLFICFVGGAKSPRKV
jgi:hypothetical protein